MSILKTAKVPADFEELFLRAEKIVSSFFKSQISNPESGTIEIGDSRYILIRGASLSVEFFTLIRTFLGPENIEQADNFSSQLLYDLAHSIGKADAAEFHQKMNLMDPIEKLSAGPIHFSHSGWAFVDIKEGSVPSPDENYCIVYEHPYSFEADAWIEKNLQSTKPICMMNAGYSSGWCEESFGINLEAIEITCRANSHEKCLFLMGPPHTKLKSI